MRHMPFEEWMYKTHKITMEMYEKRSPQIKDAINFEYNNYVNENMYYEDDIETQLTRLEKKLFDKKETLEHIKFSQDDNRKKKLMAEIADLEDSILEKENDIERDNAYSLLSGCGVPFFNGEPIGIGDD